LLLSPVHDSPREAALRAAGGGAGDGRHSSGRRRRARGEVYAGLALPFHSEAAALPKVLTFSAFRGRAEVPRRGGDGNVTTPDSNAVPGDQLGAGGCGGGAGSEAVQGSGPACGGAGTVLAHDGGAQSGGAGGGAAQACGWVRW